MTSRDRAGIIVLTVLAALLGFYLYDRIGLRMGGTPSSLRSEFATEEEWIVGEIVRDVAEMAAFALGLPPSSAELDFELSAGSPLPGVRLDSRIGSLAAYSGALSLEGSFWNPDNYVALASGLFGPGLPAAETKTSAVPETLLDARAVVLAEESLRISERLAADMRNASAHEEAALLLAAFALREAAYEFEDVRFLLGRITAHLAVARALRNGELPGTAGVIADGALLTIAGRHSQADETLARLRDRSPAVASWKNALYMYSTLDWRGLEGQGDSLLERVQRFRAMVQTLGSVTAAARFQEAFESELADWGRTVVWQYDGAASDRYFVTTQLQRELAEIQEVWTVETGEPLAQAGLEEALDVPAGRLVGEEGPRVLGWGAWAAFYQRQVCGLLAAADRLFEDGLGVPEWAQEYRRETRRMFSGLSLHPIVEVRRTRRVGARVEDTLGMDDSIALARRSPDLVNPLNWSFLTDTAMHMMRKRGMPRAEVWFSRAVLETSLLADAWVRLPIFVSAAPDEVPIVGALRAMSPRHPMAINMTLNRLPDEERTRDRFVAELGERLEFDVAALRYLLEVTEEDEEERISILARTCELDRDECDDLAWALVDSERLEDAARAFQKMVDEAPDRVGVCNESPWLVSYYFERGRIAEARAVASMAAEVYCGWGLYAQAYLSERLGEIREAESWYQKYAERYHADEVVSFPLLGFYYRMAQVERREEFGAKLEKLLARIFPQGLEPLPSAPEASPPIDGVLIDGESGRLEEAGLRGGDVVVGLDGFRLRSLDQYDAIRHFRALVSDAQDMRLRVWRQSGYLDLEARNRERRFGVKVRNLGSPGPSIERR